MGSHEVLAGLDADQLAAVTCSEQPLAIVAGAGAGKTLVVTRRIAYRVSEQQIEERHVAVLTFSRQAAGELVRRLAGLDVRGVTAGTFHGVAYAMLRQRWAEHGRPAPTLMPIRAGLLTEAVRAAGGGRRSQLDTAALGTELDWSRAQLIRPQEYAAAVHDRGRRVPWPANLVVDAFLAYERSKRDKRVIDFDDLLELTLAELQADSEFAAQVHWRLRHFFVDEFQDVNPLQHALLEAWRGGRPDLCVVGDPRQAIYGWNGSDPRLLLDVEETYPGIRVIRLTRNYRCAPGVIEAAAGVLAATTSPDDSVAVRPPVGGVEFAGAPDPTAEAELVADRLRRSKIPGARWRAMAVLARTNAQLDEVARVLARRGIPTELVTKPAPDPDDWARRRLLTDARRVGSPAALAAWGRDLDDGTEGVPASPLHRRIATAVQQFLRSVPGGSGDAFAEWYELTGGDGDAGDRTPLDAVQLLTFHAAKGREWRVVAVIGAESGLVPHAGATTPESAAEELRLLYVALTRAGDQLLVTWAESRNRRRTGRSALLNQIVELDLAELPVPPPTVLAEARSSTVITLANPTLRALRTWRSRAAYAARLSDHAIVDDDTLDEIAAARPTSIDELSLIPGMTPLAAHRLGPRLLAVLAELEE